MSQQKRELTTTDVNTAQGDETTKRIMLSWFNGGNVVTFDQARSAIIIDHPIFGQTGFLDLETGQMATDTPVQGEQELAVDDELLLLARTVCDFVANG